MNVTWQFPSASGSSRLSWSPASMRPRPDCSSDTSFAAESALRAALLSPDIPHSVARRRQVYGETVFVAGIPMQIMALTLAKMLRDAGLDDTAARYGPC